MAHYNSWHVSEYHPPIPQPIPTDAQKYDESAWKPSGHNSLGLHPYLQPFVSAGRKKNHVYTYGLFHSECIYLSSMSHCLTFSFLCCISSPWASRAKQVRRKTVVSGSLRPSCWNPILTWIQNATTLSHANPKVKGYLHLSDGNGCMNIMLQKNISKSFLQKPSRHGWTHQLL